MPIPALLLALTAAQASTAHAAAPRYFGRPFISPMGEPFRALAPGDDPLADWFRQADRNRDGILTAIEMQQDADRFFAALDTDHDGQIDPDEIDHYELQLAPEVQGEPVAMRGGKTANQGDDATDPDPDDPGSVAGGGFTGPEGAGRFGLLSIPEPVASADTDLSRTISLDEFRRAALNRFQLLDSNHSGKLTLAQLEALRPSSPFRLGRHGRHGR